jgi:hypothetical protein
MHNPATRRALAVCLTAAFVLVAVGPDLIELLDRFTIVATTVRLALVVTAVKA